MVLQFAPIVFGAGMLFVLIIGLAIGIPILVGGGAISVKIIQLLFFTKVGSFPMWSLWIVTILGYIILKKAKMRGYAP